VDEDGSELPLKAARLRCQACGVATIMKQDASAPIACWACGGGPLRAVARLEWEAGQPRRVTPIDDST